jgi:hypothetical protein
MANVPGADDGTRPFTYLGVGCFTFFAGLASGAMIAVLVAKIVGAIQKCPSGEQGQPCNWHLYALAGAVIGMISLPALAIRRLRQGDAAARNSQ